MLLQPAILLPVRIPTFYSKSRSLYANFSLLPSSLITLRLPKNTYLHYYYIIIPLLEINLRLIGGFNAPSNLEQILTKI